MIPDVSEALSWLEKHPEALTGIGRGIERESLRVQPDGHLSQQGHPGTLGSALTHEWIITDFAESLLEFVTPVDRDVSHLLAFLRDIHRHVSRELGNERLWPFSMPCIIRDPENITLAQYGTSNIGRMKTVYREGLKHRYGSLMQVISGLHYNFSLPEAFWKAKFAEKDAARIKMTSLTVICSSFVTITVLAGSFLTCLAHPRLSVRVFFLRAQETCRWRVTAKVRCGCRMQRHCV